MRIAIDMQGAQSTGSRQRGIGRYSLAFSKEMARLRGEHEVFLVLNGLFVDSIKPIHTAFAGLLPDENIRVWAAPARVSFADYSNDARRQAAEFLREAFITSLQPDIVLNTSLFEGLVDDAITSIGSFATDIPSAVILYDLIPWIHRSIYLDSPVVERWYLAKIENLRRADLLLSISASSGQEAVQYLDFPAEQVVNISTACDDHFYPVVVDETARTELFKTYGLKRPFVMYTGGIDHRKNIEGLISAFASLPKDIRAGHQLAVVCSVQPIDRDRLERLANTEGLGADDLVFTGYVPEADLLSLYNLCKLFVFPSWHEGFGLPALEAMACGRAVIGANTSSVPEVIGRQDALFDPHNCTAITDKIEEVLTNDDFRQELERYGLVQAKKFSWKQTALQAWDALEKTVSERKQVVAATDLRVIPQRQRLAYISPLPPEQSGISDYSAALLRELVNHYQIDVICAQNEVSDPWVLANCPVHDVAWFRQYAHHFDRVLYHFGNSEFHSHMFDLLREIPGVVVLHDFYLSGILAHLDIHGYRPYSWARSLVHAHGWTALKARYEAEDASVVIYEYPCNLEIFQRALGVIVHSEYSRRLAGNWYGEGAADDCSVIPLLRVPANSMDSCAARKELGFDDDNFIVCSFGHLGPTKLSHRLLSAWLASPLAKDSRCHLIFVGQNHGGDFGVGLERTLHASAVAGSIRITGWTEAERYQTWLSAADVGVQLRTLSRGETSAAVLDCMNHGLATIVNANGSMADLPVDALWKLPDEFSDEQLVEALTILWQNSERRSTLGQHAIEVIHGNHQPSSCAEQYAQALERYYLGASKGLLGLVDRLPSIGPSLPEADWPHFAEVLADNFPPHPHRKQLFLDVSGLVRNDGKEKTQSDARKLVLACLLNPPEGWAVEPVYATTDAPGYRRAGRFASQVLGVHDSWAEDEPIGAWLGDVFLGLYPDSEVVTTQKDHLHEWQNRGVKVCFVIHDLLPITKIKKSSRNAQVLNQSWHEALSSFDAVLCATRALADDFSAKVRNNPRNFSPGIKIGQLSSGVSFDALSLHGSKTEINIPTHAYGMNILEILDALSNKNHDIWMRNEDLM